MAQGKCFPLRIQESALPNFIYEWHMTMLQVFEAVLSLFDDYFGKDLSVRPMESMSCN